MRVVHGTAADVTATVLAAIGFHQCPLRSDEQTDADLATLDAAGLSLFDMAAYGRRVPIDRHDATKAAVFDARSVVLRWSPKMFWPAISEARQTISWSPPILWGVEWVHGWATWQQEHQLEKVAASASKAIRFELDTWQAAGRPQREALRAASSALDALDCCLRSISLPLIVVATHVAKSAFLVGRESSGGA